VVVAKHISPEAWATACFTLGGTYYELNRPAEARPWLERTVTLRPTAEVYYMLSDCLDFGGDTPAAIQAARRACELAPDRPRYCDQLIHLLTKTGEFAEIETLRPRLNELIQYRRRIDPPK
jgi:tetratricopeptide (TPR) repeat protein